MRSLLSRMLWIGSAAVLCSSPELAAAQARPTVAGWQAPVGGEVVRPFHLSADPFAGGAHRGIDLAARPDALVGATCAGEVAFAGAVAGSRVVTLACGQWRVTHLPLSRVAVGTGHRVRPGQLLGTVAASPDHAGLHVGVRRAGRRFGYVDPWPLLGGAVADPPGPVAVRRPWASRPRLGPVPRPRLSPPARQPVSPLDRPHPVAASPGGVAGVPESARPPRGDERARPLAPPLAWFGLAVLLVGVFHARPRSRPAWIRLRAKEPATRVR